MTRTKRAYWIVPLAIGALLPLLYWWFNVRDYPVITVGHVVFMKSELREMARHGTDPDEYVALLRMGNILRQHTNGLTDAEWQQVFRSANSKNWDTKSLALAAMAEAGGPDRPNNHRDQVLTTLRQILDNPASPDTTRATALEDLQSAKAPDWQQEAETLQHDRSKFLSDIATEVLQASQQR